MLCSELHRVPSPGSSFLNQGPNHRLGSVVSAELSLFPFRAVLQCTGDHQNLFILNTEGINIPADQPITKLKNLEDVVVPTMEIKVIYY